MFTELQRAVNPGVLLHGETLGKTFRSVVFFALLGEIDNASEFETILIRFN